MYSHLEGGSELLILSQCCHEAAVMEKFPLADTESGRQTWAGVLQFLEMCTTSDSATHRETGMMLIE